MQEQKIKDNTMAGKRALVEAKSEIEQDRTCFTEQKSHAQETFMR
jgi:hypothetical protein